MTDRVPEWHPRGNLIAFDSNRDGNTAIYVMKADGSEQTRLTYNPGTDRCVNWNNRGKGSKN